MQYYGIVEDDPPDASPGEAFVILLTKDLPEMLDVLWSYTHKRLVLV